MELTCDAAGRVTEKRTGSGAQTTFSYGPGDRLDTVTDPVTGTTDVSYDASGELAELSYADRGAGAEDVAYTRDVLGRVETVSRHGGADTDPTEFTASYSYDAAGNLARVRGARGDEFHYRYDADNRVVERRWQLGSDETNAITTTYSYDRRDRLTSVVHKAVEGTTETVIASRTYERGASGEPTQITREDGSFVELAYDEALRVSEEWHFDASGTLEETITYSYDADGNRTARTTAAGTETYRYDAGWKLRTVSRDGTVQQRFGYDDAGRVTRVERGGRTVELGYDVDDHLTEWTDTGAGASVSYAFDGRGQLVERGDGVTDRGQQHLPGPTPGRESLESPHLLTGSNGGAIGGYVYGRHEYPVMRFGAGGGDVLYLEDAQGSIIALATRFAEQTATIHYDSFGNIREVGGDTSLADISAARGGDFRFHGLWLDGTMGLYHARARAYDPKTGRFLQRDPAQGQRAQPGTFHPYALRTRWEAHCGVRQLPDRGSSDGSNQGVARFDNNRVGRADRRAAVAGS